MGTIKKPASVLLLIAAFSPSEEILLCGKEQMTRDLGPIVKESPTFRFDHFTNYYEHEMGVALFKRFWIFENLIDPGTLAAVKCLTNQREEEISQQFSSKFDAPRLLNLDPGYLDLGKLILASTKDHAHRIYLNQGIFAETTLIYTKKQWTKLPWTYPDYQSDEYHAFFNECRDYLHSRRTT